MADKKLPHSGTPSEHGPGWIEWQEPFTVKSKPKQHAKKRDLGSPFLIVGLSLLVGFFAFMLFAAPKAEAPATDFGRVEINPAGETGGITEERETPPPAPMRPGGDLSKEFLDELFPNGFTADDVEIAPAPDVDTVSNWGEVTA